MIYSDILPNWMNYEPVYEQAVSEGIDGDLFIELGTFLGRSAAFMAQKIKESGKKIDFITIDLFEADENNDHRQYFPKNSANMDVFDVACDNMTKCNVRDYVTIVKGESIALAPLIKNEMRREINFIFIDASHTYKGVKTDIETFLPLMAPGSIMAGHDYNLPEVKRAVDEKFNTFQLKHHLNSWIYKLPK